MGLDCFWHTRLTVSAERASVNSKASFSFNNTWLHEYFSVTTGEAVASVPSQRHVVSLTVHDVHQSKEPPSMMYLSCSCK